MNAGLTNIVTRAEYVVKNTLWVVAMKKDPFMGRAEG